MGRAANRSVRGCRALRAGLAFTEGALLGAPKVTSLHQAFARTFGLGRDAVGKRISDRRRDTASALGIEIEGMITDAKCSDVKGAVPPVLYLPYRQLKDVGRSAGLIPAVMASEVNPTEALRRE